MKQFRLFLAAFAALVAVMVLLIWMSPYSLRHTALSFWLGSKPHGLLKTMGVPEGAYNLSEIKVVGPDGPMPEIANRSFEIRSTPEALRQFFEAKCKEVGLGPANPDHLRMEPDLLCSHHAHGVGDTVLLTSTCTAESCRVTVEARRI